MHGLTGERTLLRIHIGERDKFHGKPLYEAIVHLLRERHFAGATVFRGIMGFGASAGIHTEKVLRLSLDLPLVVECVETEVKIQAILPELDQMIGGGLITLERANVIIYRGENGHICRIGQHVQRTGSDRANGRFGLREFQHGPAFDRQTVKISSIFHLAS